MNRIIVFLCLLSIVPFKTIAQDISLFRQFNGHYDYLAFGNTLNPAENNLDRTFCEILPSSQADFMLPASASIQSAYLFWAGSGDGDQTVTLNGNSINAEEIFIVNYAETATTNLIYFSCYAEVTNLITSIGNGTYELSDLDISDALNANPRYCGNRTNFAGWAIYIIYEDASLPLNQISLFQGLEIINRSVQEKVITLNNINVLDNNGAKIGFLAWEGDQNLNYGESLIFNNNILSNLPLNPANNAFNGTNTFTNSNTFYNCDIDVYNIENNIAIGDTSAEIKLTTGDFDSSGALQADLIILNNIITVLNSQLPDATIIVNNFLTDCGLGEVDISFSVFNTNSTASLPANTPISFYVDTILIGQAFTQNEIAINGFENGDITLIIPNTASTNFELIIVVDDLGSGIGIVNETNEGNNSDTIEINTLTIPPISQLPNLTSCDLSLNTAIFDLTIQYDNILFTSESDVSFYTLETDAVLFQNEIINPQSFTSSENSQEIFIRVEKTICYELYKFNLIIEKCPPVIPNLITPNDDTFNDSFNIIGLYNIYLNHKLLIYNRYGTLVFQGNNDLKWNGKANKGFLKTKKELPTGTYFYVLHLNETNLIPLIGWVYLSN